MNNICDRIYELDLKLVRLMNIQSKLQPLYENPICKDISDIIVTLQSTKNVRQSTLIELIGLLTKFKGHSISTFEQQLITKNIETTMRNINELIKILSMTEEVD